MKFGKRTLVLSLASMMVFPHWQVVRAIPTMRLQRHLKGLEQPTKKLRLIKM